MDLFRKLKLKYPCSDNQELFDHDYVVKHEDDTTHNTYMDTFEKSYLKIRSGSDINAAYAILALCNSEPLDLSFSSRSSSPALSPSSLPTVSDNSDLVMPELKIKCFEEAILKIKSAKKTGTIIVTAQLNLNSTQPRRLIFGVQPYFDPNRKRTSKKKWKTTSKKLLKK